MNEATYRHRLPDDVAAMLCRARAARGEGLRAVARRAGIRHGYLWLIERGDRCPSVPVAAALADALALDESSRERLLAVAVPNAGRAWRSG